MELAHKRHRSIADSPTKPRQCGESPQMPEMWPERGCRTHQKHHVHQLCEVRQALLCFVRLDKFDGRADVLDLTGLTRMCGKMARNQRVLDRWLGTNVFIAWRQGADEHLSVRIPHDPVCRQQPSGEYCELVVSKFWQYSAGLPV